MTNSIANQAQTERNKAGQYSTRVRVTEIKPRPLLGVGRPASRFHFS
ncbi:MAG: hypothetical protein ACXW3F_07740 [Pyrinomonadaceae bacterium]